MARSADSVIASCVLSSGAVRLEITVSGWVRFVAIGWEPTRRQQADMDRGHGQAVATIRERYSPADGHPAGFVVQEFARLYGATDVVLNIPVHPGESVTVY